MFLYKLEGVIIIAQRESSFIHFLNSQFITDIPCSIKFSYNITNTITLFISTVFIRMPLHIDKKSPFFAKKK